MTVSFCGVLLGAPPGEPLPDADILGARVVAVQPTDLAAQDGAARGIALAAVMAQPLTGKAATAIAALGLPPLPEAGDGLSFSGGSDAGDVIALHAGYVVGRIATHAAAGDAASVRTLSRWVEARQGALDFLSEPVTQALVAFVSGAVDGRVESAGIGTLLQMTEAGIATGPARGHGYFAAGVWAGMALLGSATETGRANLIDVGGGLMTLLEQDAGFDGSDKVVAAHLRAIARELSSDGPRLAVVNDEGRALMAIRADSEL